MDLIELVDDPMNRVENRSVWVVLIAAMLVLQMVLRAAARVELFTAPLVVRRARDCWPIGCAGVEARRRGSNDERRSRSDCSGEAALRACSLRHWGEAAAGAR